MPTTTHTENAQRVAKIYAEKWTAEADELRERLIFLCEDLAPSRGTYDYLESRTSIGASKWKNVFLRRQMPTVEMLMAMCHYRGAWTLWLLTGTDKPSDAAHVLFDGHTSPSEEAWEQFKAHRKWMKGKKESVNKKD